MDNVSSQVDAGMGAEDVTFFVTGQNIPNVYWAIGGSSMVEVDAQIKVATIASYHSPLFKIDTDDSMPFALETTVSELTE